MIELIVVLAIMGVMAGVVGLAVAQWDTPAEVRALDTAQAAIADARRRAVRSGKPVTVAISLDTVAPLTTPLLATAFPDGSVIADAALSIDRFTGRAVRPQPVVLR